MVELSVAPITRPRGALDRVPRAAPMPLAYSVAPGTRTRGKRGSRSPGWRDLPGLTLSPPSTRVAV